MVFFVLFNGADNKLERFVETLLIPLRGENAMRTACIRVCERGGVGDGDGGARSTSLEISIAQAPL